ncbi:MAG: methyltransferase domain-containing protein [Oscillospiraceae bacterium]|nr:methyltransferase domain-containing protein [Oscillospiraceae bacterium]
MSELCKRVQWLDSILDTDKIISGEFNSIRDIKLYYAINRIPYRLWHSREGFMHFRVSKDGTFSNDDIYYQPDTISGYIPPMSRVLELGPGQGANLLYLAGRHPDSYFCGVDLLPAKFKDPPSNLRIIKRDYSDMSNFPDNVFDVAYAIETIVHSSQKDRIFKEVYRVLKPGGVFIVYDYTLLHEYANYDPLTQKAIALISKGGTSPLIESETAWRNYFTSNGFREEKAGDLSERILPDLKRLQRKSERVLKYPNRTKWAFRLFPSLFANNALLAYLTHDACQEGVFHYKEWIFRK